MPKVNIALAGGLFFIFMATSPLHAARQLNTESGKPLDVLVGDVKTWKELHAIHRKYPMDDGAVADEYSGFVVETMAKHWKRMPQLIAITKQDPAFETFVLQHIDETTDTAELRSVIRNASRRCPAGSHRFCAKIAAAAKAALKVRGKWLQK